MKVLINNAAHELPDGAMLADAVDAAVATLQLQPPFAAAVNQQFVPRARYAAQPLAENDRIEIISPVTGG
ncbi:sulfur carrier protein ThiS [Variovorax sp. VNK109]|jgi:sulfur carrier protein|uniref:sulfur carrier protein ThiS n=1 Tax=Variovorax sp. VNK109 TaxID=3400919 RepID=UPI003BFCACB8